MGDGGVGDLLDAVDVVDALAAVRPGARLTIELDGSARGVRFEVKEGERVAASGQFEPAAS